MGPIITLLATITLSAVPASRVPGEYVIRAAGMSRLDTFSLTGVKHVEGSVECNRDDGGDGVWNCFECFDESSAGDIWTACNFLGSCVEGYNGNQSKCHF